MILPQTDLEGARQLAEQIRQTVAGNRIRLKSNGRYLGNITLSIGCAEYHPQRAAERSDPARRRGALPGQAPGSQPGGRGAARAPAAASAAGLSLAGLPGGVGASARRGRRGGQAPERAGRRGAPTAWRSQPAQASAGSGGQLMNACTASQPQRRRQASCSCRSTPSATTRRPSSRASATIARDHRAALRRRPGTLLVQLARQLERVEHAELQAAQRGRAAAVAVEREPHAQLLQRGERRAAGVGVAEQQLLGELDLEAARRRARRRAGRRRAARPDRSRRAAGATAAAAPDGPARGPDRASGAPGGRRPRTASR